MPGNQKSRATPVASRWPHRLAWALVCCTFPLIWVGGLVTTYGAGMAVPDWPSTFGYWLYYPVRSWLAVWDVFLEHGHRTLGMLAGLTTIALAVALWRCDSRRWMRWLGVVALGGVCFQGVLGGLRVIGNKVVLANVHGCTAPLFFGLAAALVTVTSPMWLAHALPHHHPSARGTQRGAFVLAVLTYVQIVLGAQVRHLLPDAHVGWFQCWVWLHVINAGALTGAIVWLAVRLSRRLPDERILLRRGRLLLILVVIQCLLGVGAWVTNYGIPLWFTDYVWALRYTVTSQGRLQAILTTSHVAVGSLTLTTAISLALWSRRLLGDAKKGTVRP